MENERKYNGILGVMIFAFVIIVGLCLAFGLGVIGTKDDKKEESEDKIIEESNQTINSNEKIEKEENSFSDKKDENLNVWNGIYEKENISILLIRSGEDEVTVTITYKDIQTNKTQSKTEKVDLNSTEKLKDDGIGDSILIERKNNSIVVKAKDKDEDDVLNKIDGTYEKKEFTVLGWDGIYRNEDVSISLAQYDDETVYVTIKKGSSIFAKISKNVTEDKIVDESTSFGNVNKIAIEKKNNAIVIEASSSKEDNILNKINGTYNKNN